MVIFSKRNYFCSVSDPEIILEEPGSYQDTKLRAAYCDMWDQMGYFY
jgi:hypothetical protein